MKIVGINSSCKVGALHSGIRVCVGGGRDKYSMNLLYNEKETFAFQFTDVSAYDKSEALNSTAW